jgi:hypothetical protein
VGVAVNASNGRSHDAKRAVRCQPALTVPKSTRLVKSVWVQLRGVISSGAVRASIWERNRL